MIEGALWRKWVFFYAPMALFLLFLLFPFYWMMITSFKTEDQMRSLVAMFWPSPAVLENYTQLLTKTDFVRSCV